MPDTTASTPGSDSPDIRGLLARSARGDESAWRSLIGLYGRRVYALARSRCRRDDLAEEIAQSVFVTVATKLALGQYAEQGRFEAWLFRVTMNRVRDEIRRMKRHAVPTDPAEFCDAVATNDGLAAGEPADLDALRRAMNSLAPADREVVELRHHGGLSFKQIAEALEEPLGTVLARHHRALRKLKEQIESQSASAGRGSANEGEERP